MSKIRVLVNGLKFPRGLALDATGCLWCVEREGEGLFCRDKDGSTMRVHTGGRPNGAAVHENYLYFSDLDQHAIRRMHIETKVVDYVLDKISGRPLGSPNDLLFDSQDNLIFSCSGLREGEESGYVGVYSANNIAEIIADGLSYSSGLALFPTTRTLLIAETQRQRIWQGFWDAEALSWETIRVWSQVMEVSTHSGQQGPNGMAIGPDGNLYVALFGAGLIRVLSPDGEFVRDVELPGQNPTNCIFDPSGKLGLIVTESERGELLSIEL